jgi:hypothetical protein
MHPKLEDLARRFKAALDAEQHARDAAAARLSRSRAEARAARASLFDDLAALGRAIGAVDVHADDDGVTLTFGEQRLAFLADGDGDRVRVAIGGVEGEPIRIFRHPEAEFAWVLSVGAPGAEAVEALFDRGLVHLLTEGLGLPAPLPSAPAAGRSQPPLDALVPDPR